MYKNRKSRTRASVSGVVRLDTVFGQILPSGATEKHSHYRGEIAGFSPDNTTAKQGWESTGAKLAAFSVCVCGGGDTTELLSPVNQSDTDQS